MIYYFKNGRICCSVGLTDKSSCYVRTSTRNIALYDKNKPLTEDNYFNLKKRIKMSSLTRTIRRKMIFSSMNKQQRLIWKRTHGKDTEQVRSKLKNNITEKENKK